MTERRHTRRFDWLALPDYEKRMVFASSKVSAMKDPRQVIYEIQRAEYRKLNGERDIRPIG